MTDDLVRTLATKAGIATLWSDQKGVEHVVPVGTLRALLGSLGLPAESDDQVHNSLSAVEIGAGQPQRLGFATARAGQPVPLPFPFPPGTPAELLLESGEVRGLSSIEGFEGLLTLPPVEEPGYHRLRLAGEELTLAVAPAACMRLAEKAGHGAVGLTAQIYSLRRQGDFGIGDFGGLARFGEAAARQGVQGVSISPVHALFSASPQNFSPYSPSSRLFLNPLHADADGLFPAHAVADVAMQAGLAAERQRLEALRLVDWQPATLAKQALFRALFERLATDGELAGLAADFERFASEASELLTLHATFEALHARAVTGQLAAGRPLWHWRDWPGGLSDPHSAATVAFRQEAAQEIRYHIFLQWLASRCYAACQARCREAGMGIGLIADLAIGMDGAGSHAWSRQQEILVGASVGAPPDFYNANGQNWGLTTFSPRGLAASGYAPFIDTLRAVLRHAGGLRIDHIMGLRRLWLVPEGAAATEGAYLSLPSETLFRLLALESHRHGAPVIGEDLGTLPDGFREELGHMAISGMRVLRFERDRDRFRQPPEWSPHAVAMTTTHDAISTAGWWAGADLDPPEHAHSATTPGDPHAVRAWDRGLLWSAFQEAGVAWGERPAPEDPQPAVDAAVRFIGRTPCEMKLLAAEDAVGVLDQPNVPGTITEKPNWRHRLDGDAGAVLEAEAPRRRLAILRGEA